MGTDNLEDRVAVITATSEQLQEENNVLKYENKQLRERINKLEERLEITHQWMSNPNDIENLIKVEIPPEERDSTPDGIYCRDCTIELQDTRIADLKEYIIELKEHISELRDNQ